MEKYARDQAITNTKFFCRLVKHVSTFEEHAKNTKCNHIVKFLKEYMQIRFVNIRALFPDDLC
uniref:Uncharacterized protein n=1 Tax=Romanomermis culicivorax TaxID=13658 RepID=A0A915IFL5_ROMCU